LAISGSTTINPFDVCGAVVVTYIGNALKRLIENPRRSPPIGNFIQRYTEAAALPKEKSTTNSKGILFEDVLL
jgi:hypothetical protein